MSDELERLKRLRNRQLADRNPMEKQKQIQDIYVRKERKARSQRYTLREAWQAIPHVYRSPLIGSIIGICITAFLPLLWDSVWALWVGVFATVILIVIGVVVGQALDVRDNLRDYSKD